MDNDLVFLCINIFPFSLFFNGKVTRKHSLEKKHCIPSAICHIVGVTRLVPFNSELELCHEGEQTKMSVSRCALLLET